MHGIESGAVQVFFNNAFINSTSQAVCCVVMEELLVSAVQPGVLFTSSADLSSEDVVVVRGTRIASTQLLPGVGDASTNASFAVLIHVTISPLLH